MKKFIITIDTEGDNLWENKITRHGIKEITTKNAENLIRFQILCEKYKFIPTYLTNYEMSQNSFFIDLARSALKKKRCEIGMHMHAWNSPPVVMLPYNPKGTHSYIGEYEPKLQWEKMYYLKNTLEDVFQIGINSHRSGRWYLDEFTVKCLKKLGVCVDCTVTPGISWGSQIGNNKYGVDYSKDKYRGKYMLSGKNIHNPGKSGIYEIPPTIIPRFQFCGMKISKQYSWFRPTGQNLDEMMWIKNHILKSRKIHYLEFMLHSSEMMPGANPTFKNRKSVEKLFVDLDILFHEISKDYEGIGITDYALS